MTGTPHDHTTFVEGCFRCDLSRQEAIDQEPDRNQAMLESYRSGGTSEVRWKYEPCAREHEPGKVCILPNEHELHPLLEELRKDPTVKDNPMALHLQLCPSAHHMDGTARGITCSHDFWWNLTAVEQYYLNNKI